MSPCLGRKRLHCVIQPALGRRCRQQGAYDGKAQPRPVIPFERIGYGIQKAPPNVAPPAAVSRKVSLQRLKRLGYHHLLRVMNRP
jgi:hypothetical protein